MDGEQADSSERGLGMEGLSKTEKKKELTDTDNHVTVVGGGGRWKWKRVEGEQLVMEKKNPQKTHALSSLGDHPKSCSLIL